LISEYNVPVKMSGAQSMLFANRVQTEYFGSVNTR